VSEPMLLRTEGDSGRREFGFAGLGERILGRRAGNNTSVPFQASGRILYRRLHPQLAARKQADSAADGYLTQVGSNPASSGNQKELE
jgi:hypothetical protein